MDMIKYLNLAYLTQILDFCIVIAFFFCLVYALKFTL